MSSESPFFHKMINDVRACSKWKDEDNEDFKNSILKSFLEKKTVRSKLEYMRSLLVWTSHLSIPHYSYVSNIFINFYELNRVAIILEDADYQHPIMCEMVQQLYNTSVSITNFINFKTSIANIDTNSGISYNRDKYNDTASQRMVRRTPGRIKNKII